MLSRFTKPIRNVLPSLVSLHSLADPTLSPFMLKVLQVSPTIFSQAVYLSPIPAMRTFKLNNSTGTTSPLPYSAMVVNGYLWTVYGALLQDPTILSATFPGFILGTYYTWTFSKYCPAHVPMKSHIVVIGAMCSFATGAALCLPAETAATVVGLERCGVVMVMFAGPLTTIKTVLATKTTASLPFAFTLATIGNCAAWTCYGALVTDDPLIWVPNSVGLLAGIAQLGLFARFGIQK